MLFYSWVFLFFAKYAKMNEKFDDENRKFSKIDQNFQKLLTYKQGKISFYLKGEAGRLATTRE